MITQALALAAVLLLSAATVRAIFEGFFRK
jgi:hypothetical protein